MFDLFCSSQEICILSLATEFAGDKMTMVNFFGLVLCLCGISVHVVTKATKGDLTVARTAWLCLMKDP